MGQTLQFCVVGVLGPRASCAGDCAHRATEHANGQDGRAELQLQHVCGRQLRLGVELCAAWEAHLCICAGKLRAGCLLGLARDRGLTQD